MLRKSKGGRPRTKTPRSREEDVGGLPKIPQPASLKVPLLEQERRRGPCTNKPFSKQPESLTNDPESFANDPESLTIDSVSFTNDSESFANDSFGEGEA